MKPETLQIMQALPPIITSIGVIVGFYIAYRQLRSSAHQHSLQKKSFTGNLIT